MEKAIIQLDGKDYHIFPGKDNDNTYMVEIDTQQVTFRPNESGKLSASHDHIPNEFLSKLAQKIESYFF